MGSCEQYGVQDMLMYYFDRKNVRSDRGQSGGRVIVEAVM